MANNTFHSLLDTSNAGCLSPQRQAGSTSCTKTCKEPRPEQQSKCAARGPVLTSSSPANQNTSRQTESWATQGLEQVSAFSPIPPCNEIDGGLATPLQRNFHSTPNTNTLSTKLPNRCCALVGPPRLFQSSVKESDEHGHSIPMQCAAQPNTSNILSTNLSTIKGSPVAVANRSSAVAGSAVHFQSIPYVEKSDEYGQSMTPLQGAVQPNMSNILSTNLSSIKGCSPVAGTAGCFQSIPYFEDSDEHVQSMKPLQGAAQPSLTKEESELRHDSLAMLSTMVSTIMSMASRVPNVPNEYYMWTEKYLKCIKNQQGQHPPNVKRILKMLSSRDDRVISDEDCKCIHIPLTYFDDDFENII